MWAELVLTAAAVVAFAVWQWRDLARERQRSAAANARQRAEEDGNRAAADSTSHNDSAPGSAR